MLLNLPDDCILRTISFVDDAQDVWNLQNTCAKLWRLVDDSRIWGKRLEQHFDLRTQGTPAKHLWRAYKVVKDCESRQALNFLGVFTDGGCDENLAAYWVGHFFEPNHFKSYCTAAAKNVNCIALLTDPKISDDRRLSELKHRRFLIKHCVLPFGIAERFIHFVGPSGLSEAEFREAAVELERKTTSELESILAQFFHLFQQGASIGRLLFYDVQELDLPAASRAVEALIERAAQAEGRSVRGAGINVSKCNNILMDAHILKAQAADPNKRSIAGIMEEILINRMGQFSCPIATGAVFVANLPSPDSEATAFEQAAMNFAAMLKSKVSKNLDGAVSPLHDVIKLSARGELPPVAISSRNNAGCWVEFEPGWRHSRDLTAQPLLYPVVFFQFWTTSQAYGYWQACQQLGRDPVTAERLPDAPEELHKDCQDTVTYFDLDRFGWGFTAENSRASITDEEWYENIQREYIGWDYLAYYYGSDNNPTQHRTYASNFIQEPDDEDNLTVFDERLNMNLLDIKLRRPHAGNCVIVKLIDQEDRMEEWSDEHAQPNIDATSIRFWGRQVVLPSGLQLAC